MKETNKKKKIMKTFTRIQLATVNKFTYCVIWYFNITPSFSSKSLYDYRHQCPWYMYFVPFQLGMLACTRYSQSPQRSFFVEFEETRRNAQGARALLSTNIQSMWNQGKWGDDESTSELIIHKFVPISTVKYELNPE